jgi:transposase
MVSPKAKPKLETVVQLDFYSALKEVAQGKKITKLEWNDVETYLFLQDGRLKIKNEKGIFDLIVSDGDMNGLDWIIK